MAADDDVLCTKIAPCRNTVATVETVATSDIKPVAVVVVVGYLGE